MSEEINQQQAQQQPEAQVVVADRAMEQFESAPDRPAHANGQLADASAYQGEMVKREFVPDEDQPDLKYTVWIRTRILKGSDHVRIQGMINQMDIDNANLQQLRFQLAHVKPDSRIQRNEATLRRLDIDDEEFKDNEKAYFDRIEKLQDQINGWLMEYEEAVEKKKAAIEAIIAKPSYYQTLRLELFSRVIADHTIGLPESPGGQLFKVDFSSEDPKHELSDELAAALSDFLWDVLKKEGRAGKKSAKQKSRR